MNEKCKESIEFLVNELYMADELFRGYQTLYNKQVSDIDALNVAPGFFKLSLFSFLQLFGVTLSRIYDGHKDSVNLEKVLSHMNTPDIMLRDEASQLHLLAECQDLYDSQRAKIKQLRLVRDKALAHNDRQKLSGDIWLQSGLTIGDYQSLIDTAHKILCCCGTLIDLSPPTLGMGVESDIDWVIEMIKRGRESYLAEE